MRFTLSTTMVIAHIFGLILACTALYISGRICLGDALPGPDLAAALFPGLVAVALLAGIGSLFIVNRLRPLKKCCSTPGQSARATARPAWTWRVRAA